MCFNVHAPKSVQQLGLFELQPLLNDYRQLYFPYTEVLVQADPEIKLIILSESVTSKLYFFIFLGNLYFSQGNQSFNYNLRADMSNFDKLFLANTLIDIVLQSQLESLDKDHMQILYLCAGDPAEFYNSH